MLRTEVMEIDLASLRADPELCDAAKEAFAGFSVLRADLGPASEDDEAALEATEAVITTGIVEAENVLVMDMDLCVRCGNCSFACEKVHGQSRLVRRGIHIERPPRPRTQTLQHLLVPEVCIHCQDPECLTSCPTGAIARREYGQIDIEPTTCTGCMACARLCPYNAISMIPEVPVPALQPGFGARFKSWLGVIPPILPLPVTAKKGQENLVAVKCNLCADTPLNPAGARKPAYSCEENCPTGALVRVNPLEYFDEVKGRLAFVFQSPTMAVGRNIHRRDPLRQFAHIVGGLLMAVTLAAGLWAWMAYRFDSALPVFHITLRWLSGLVGGAGIAGSMVYSARRRIYRHRAGPLRYWLLAHVYLGAVAAIAILFHGGSHGGGPLTSALMVTFDLVVLTGLFGMMTYSVSPRLLTRIEGDPLLIEDLEARRRELLGDLSEIRNESEEMQRLLNGARRRFASAGYLIRQIRRREELSALLADLREEYRGQASSLAENDRTKFVEYVGKIATVRRLDALIYLHRLMRVWLPPHIIAASLMLALLIVHIVQVTFFALR
jgi:Fe-S-cluster-containing dehydrogenase component